MGDRGFYVFFGVQILLAIGLLGIVVLWPGPWNAQRIIGSVLLLSDLAMVFTARVQLGRSFSVTPQARALVTHGLYSKIRNPIYVFGTVAIAGLLMILQKRELWIIFVVIVALQSARAHKEAQVLEAKFGDEYRSYRGRTWF